MAWKTEPIQIVRPSLRDPRVTLLAALSVYTVLGQKVFFFDVRPAQIAAALLVCGVLDVIGGVVAQRRLALPLSGLITGLSLGILLQSWSLGVFVVASVWAIASKFLLTVDGRHLFNPSNFGIVASLLLSGGAATVAPGSQWGGDYLYSLVILCFGLLMVSRVRRLPAVLGWLGAYVAMGFVRMLAGQGGLVFVLGPMAGAEFTLFTFSMLPDPKTSPSERSAQWGWGIAVGVLDGLLRLGEIRFSAFYALFALCLVRPWLGALRLPRPAAAELTRGAG